MLQSDMAASLDTGRLPRMYQTYASDDAARTAERKLLSSLGKDELYSDPDFPASGSSLYFNENEPPQYASP